MSGGAFRCHPLCIYTQQTGFPSYFSLLIFATISMYQNYRRTYAMEFDIIVLRKKRSFSLIRATNA